MTRTHLLLCWPLLAALACSANGGETVIDAFAYPWADQPAPRTTFRAHNDGHRLHFTFEVEDADVIVSKTWNGESILDAEDRVEIFFAGDPALKKYWCIEIDPNGRVHDYHAQHYRRFDPSWNCPGLRAEGERTQAGYNVRGSIPLATLSELLGHPVTRGTEIRVGLFRAEFYGNTRGEADNNWISWVRPKTDAPDFHTPTAFTLWRLP